MRDGLGRMMQQMRAALSERHTRVALGGGIAVMLAAGLFIAGQKPGDSYRVLARGIRMKGDVRAITSELEKQGVCYQLSDGGRTISVPEKLWDQAVRHVSREKLYPRTREQDVRDVLDRSNGLTMLPDMQRMQRSRLQELEIARTISMYDSVEFARVHITQPRDTFFHDSGAAPVTASIFLELAPGRKLSADQVAAIKALVSHSVEGLSPMNITLCDSQGTDYSTSATRQTTAPVSPSAVRELELAQLVETVVLGKVTDHMRRLFEPETFAASVTAELEMTQVTVRPGLAPVARGDPAPDADAVKPSPAASPDTVSAQLKNVETRGRIRRLSISVLVDSRSLSAGQLEPALRQTVEEGIKAAVGFRPARGDTLSVLVAPFCRQRPMLASPAPVPEPRALRQPAAVVAAAVLPGARRLPPPDSRAAGALGFVAENFNMLWISQVSFLVFVLAILVRQVGGAGAGWRDPDPATPERCYPVRVDSVMGDAPASPDSRPGAPVSRPGSPVARCLESLLARRDRDVEGALAKVDDGTLVLALRAAAEPLRRAALARLPGGRSRTVAQAIAAHGPVPLGQMERAQLQVADLLAEAPQKGA